MGRRCSSWPSRRVVLPELAPQCAADSDGSTGSEDSEEAETMELVGRMEENQRRFENSHERLDWDSFHKLEKMWGEVLGDIAVSERSRRARRAASPRNSETKFDRLSRVLGDEFSRVVRAMCVRVTNKHMVRGRKVQRLMALRIAGGPLRQLDWEGVQQWRTPEWKAKQRPEGPAAPLEAVAPKFGKGAASGGRLGFGGATPQKTKVDIYWCGLCFDEVSFLRLLFALDDSTDPDVFGTPLAQAMVEVCWREAKWLYFCRRAIDVLTIMLLMWIGLHSRVNHHGKIARIGMMPPRCLVALNSCELFVMLAQIWLCKHVFGHLRPVFQPFLIFSWLLELVLFSASLSMVIHAQGTASFVRDHPLWLAALIVVKSMQLEARLMTLPWFQDSVLPAWKALTSRASGRFLFFLVLSMLGTLFAFVSLPRHGLTFVEIPGLWLSPASRGNLSNDLASALYIVEKMTLMGDFSEDMIQGTQWKPSYNRTDSTGYLTQVPLEDVDGDVRLSNDLPFFSLFFALLYGVVMMNLYIGILSEEYNKASDDLQRLTGSHRITVSIPVLLVKHGLAGLGLCRAERCAFRQRELRQGFWFALPRPRGDLARPEDGPEEEGREGHGAPS
ncbi:unnamed protein product [Prorocentrum cordatum]|uniref:Ion transport domain-containing protein n=1 Tax=Prorocentrum cordatum TaxID=2364126 RepID=A0ABN9TI29_9DINO|nr:unnamed protein product [Polarella glacialis]